MKLLIIADTHGDIRSLGRAVLTHHDADAIIFLGDGVREIEDMQAENPQMKIYMVQGNCDYASFAPADGLAAFGGLLFYYAHGHHYDVKSGLQRFAEAAKQRGADIALYGHTHIPAITQIDGVTLFNPGSLSDPYGRGHYGVITVEDGKAQFEHLQLP